MKNHYLPAATEVIARCRALASHSEEQGYLTRTFLSEPMRSAHIVVRQWMEQAGLNVRVDHAGNIRGCYGGMQSDGRLLIIGSHLDSVPHAGIFDGALGVVIAIGLLQLLDGRRFHFPIEVIGFSEEEGVRFGVPFIGSRALTGELDDALLAREDTQGITVRDAIRQFGLDPSRLKEAEITQTTPRYLEFHIEQGPVLDSLGFPLGIVESIVGQSRLEIQFKGEANHAGTTPMHLRHDALAGAAEWITSLEREAAAVKDLVATVGRVDVKPGAGNVIPGSVRVSLDVRHPNDAVRHDCVNRLMQQAGEIAGRRGLTICQESCLDQPAVNMDGGLTNELARAVERCRYPVHQMNSGAGHDAMIMARRMPSAMLFIRSPHGISHHPDESVLADDVAAALAAGLGFLEELERIDD
jgi:allantoate deiminase